MFRKIWLTSLIFICLHFSSYSQQIQVIDFNTFKTVYLKYPDTTYVVNFFASWCSPCLKELPDFVSFSKKIENKKIKLIFVSLDIKEEYKESLVPIIEKYGLTNTVFLLDESMSGSWIENVDSTWKGSIPATWIYKNGGKDQELFVEPMNEERLKKILK